MATVTLNAVSKTFSGRRDETVRVLDGIDVEVQDGEFLAILGASGCGKSTLLRIISGLELATSGSLAINGVDVTGLPPEKRELSMVFQNYALFPHLDVAENLLFGLKARKEPKNVQAERLTEVAQLLGLGELLTRKPAELSGGQRQRVALGRALVSGQRLILMDEPLSNLDAKLRAEMRTEIKRIQRRLGLTIIYVTHDQVEAMTMADRVMLLANGHIEQLASPADIYSSPTTATVARFIGSPPMNVIDLSAGDGLLLLADELDFEDSRGLSLGIRPEDVSVHLSRATISDGQVLLGEATVLVNELLGADRIITCGLGTDGQRRVIARTAPDQEAGMCTTVLLTAHRDRVHWFTTETGARAVQVAATA